MKLPLFDATQRILGFLKDTTCLIGTVADAADSTTKSSEVQFLPPINAAAWPSRDYIQVMNTQPLQPPLKLAMHP